MGSLPRSAPAAQPAENEFAFAKNALAERTGGRPGNFVPLHVLNVAAAVADEVVMQHALGIEPRGTALHGHFPHQTRPHQIPQIVVSGGARSARIRVIHSLEDFRSRGMPVVLQQERHYGVALRRTAQSTALQGPSDRIAVGQYKLDYI